MLRNFNGAGFFVKQSRGEFAQTLQMEFFGGVAHGLQLTQSL
jgi:hypothetical protein